MLRVFRGFFLVACGKKSFIYRMKEIRGRGSVLLKKLGKNLEGIGFIRIFATEKVN